MLKKVFGSLWLKLLIVAVLLVSLISLIANESGDSTEAKIDEDVSLLGKSETHFETLAKEEPPYKIVSVVDGDTVRVVVKGKTETLRLIGVNTPETVHPSAPVECFGREASDKTKSLLLNKSVYLEQDLTQGERDKYGRLLVYIFLEDGTNFNKLLVDEGYAYEYTYNFPYKYQESFKQAQKDAESSRKGLWADGVCEQNSLKRNIVPQIEQNQTPSTNNCASNSYNCGDFASQSQAQDMFDKCGGVSNDVHKLDGDADGEACESLL